MCGGLVDLRRALCGVAFQAVLILLALGELLVAKRLFADLGVRLALQPHDHVHQHPLDLGELVLTGEVAQSDHGLHAGCQLAEHGGLLLEREPAHQVGNLVVPGVPPRPRTGALRCSLRHHQELTACHRRDCILRSGDGIQRRAARSYGRHVIFGRGPAKALAGIEKVLRIAEISRGALKLAFGPCSLLQNFGSLPNVCVVSPLARRRVLCAGGGFDIRRDVLFLAGSFGNDCLQLLFFRGCSPQVSLRSLRYDSAPAVEFAAGFVCGLPVIVDFRRQGIDQLQRLVQRAVIERGREADSSGRE
mmetsp:Transcript_44113/g.140183  ORF Transcript_44113/g.140183 Transcript_44113/m.140183 type:complete len:304 (+) Transcript_44113:691-1602(+)